MAARLMPEPKSSGKSMVARQVQGQGGKSVCGSGFRTVQCLVRYRHSCRGTGHRNPYGLAQASTEQSRELPGEAGQGC